MEEIKKYVIVGNGIAGLSAAETIRKIDSKGKITIISAEAYLTYYRVKLSHFISKDFQDKELMIHDEKWYTERNIDVFLGKLVEKIDTESQVVQLRDGSKIEYDELLLATGSRSFIPPIKGKEKDGVFVLRTIEDLRNMQNYLQNCNSVTVLGGGLLGLEAAWAVKELNKEVNVVEFFPYLCPRQLDEALSKAFSAQLEEKGLNLYLGAATEEILGEGKVEGIKLQDGREIKTDAILISAGIRPILDLVQESDIAFDKGIKVNEKMATNIPHVYAAGDVVELDGMMVGLWPIASEQGKVAGENMAGGEKGYQLPQLTTLLNIGGISMFSAGDIKDFDDTVEEQDTSKKAHYKLYLTKNRVTGGVVINDMAKVPKLKKLVTGNVDITEQRKQGLSYKEIVENI